MKSQTGRVIADAEYWIAVQRLWSFDEPRYRWSRLVKNCERRLGRERAGGAAELQEVKQLIDVYGWQAGEHPPHNPPQLGRQHSAQHPVQHPVQRAVQHQPTQPEFGNEQRQSLNRLTSIIFALCDLYSFHASALNLQSARAVSDRGGAMLPLPWSALIQELTIARDLTNDQKQYLSFCAIVCPDWLRLLGSGPWTADPRARFVSSFFHSLLNDSQLFSPERELSYSWFSQVERLFHQQLKENRLNLPTSFLPEHLVIVEGATEQILLPHFAELLGLDWQKRAISVLAAGGANQVYKRYASLKTSIALCIDCVLDGDVGAQAREIGAILRPNDRLHILEKPAIEECFEREQIVDFCNQYFQASILGSIHPMISLSDLDGDSNQECLERLWRQRTHASFDKIGFARTVAENLQDPEEIPAAIRQVVNQIGAEAKRTVHHEAF